MNPPASPQQLRWVTVDANRLASAFHTVMDQEGPDTLLDLRHDGHGFGLTTAWPIAKDCGFRRGLVDPGHDGHGLTSAAEPSSLTWCRSAHDHNAQQLHSRVVNVKLVEPGSAVSYGGHYQTTQSGYLALVAIGFADGVPRLDPVGGFVDCGGVRFPIAGRIAMDQLIVDTGQTCLDVGSDVTVWGGDVTINEWAAWASRDATIIGATLGSRVARPEAAPRQ